MPKLINYGKKDMDKETANNNICTIYYDFFILYSDLLVDVPTLNSVVSSNYCLTRLLQCSNLCAY